MRVVVFDTETTMSDQNNPVPDLVCMSTYDGTGDAQLYHRKEAIEVFSELIRNTEIRLVAHNAPFDLRVFLKARPGLWKYVKEALESDRVRDTLIRDKLIRIKQGTLKFAKDFKLDTIAQKMLKIEPMDKGEDGWRKRYGELMHVPLHEWPERAAKYAKEDAIVTFRVYMAQQGGRKVSPCEDLQNRKAFVLHDIERYGLKTDREWHWKFRESLLVESDMLADVLIDHGILKRAKDKMSADTKKIKELVEQGYAKLGLDVPRTEPTEAMEKKGIEVGNVKTDIETILALEERPELKSKDYIGRVVESHEYRKNHVLQAFVRYKNINNKLISTYLDNMDYDVVRPRFNPLVDTGRMSCARPNLQNLPREPGIRECIVPHNPGHVICSVDFNSMELRTLGQSLYSLFNESTLRDIYLADVLADPHTLMACHEFLKIPVGKFDKSNKQHKAARNLSKVGNFGVPGGLGVESLRSFAKATYGLKLTSEEAQAVKDNFFSMYPEMRTYFKYIGNATRDPETRDPKPAEFKLPISGRSRGKCFFTSGANFFFQGPGGDVIAGALWAVYCATKDPSSVLFKKNIINVIHDEILIEVPEGEEGSACAREVERLMVEGGQTYNPDVPLAAEPALCDIWRKEMEYRTNEHGILIPDIYEIENGKPNMNKKKKDWRHGWDVSDLKAALGHNLGGMECHPLANTVFGDLRNVDFSEIC